MPRVLSFVVLLVAATAAVADKLVLVVSGEDTKLIQPFGVMRRRLIPGRPIRLVHFVKVQRNLPTRKGPGGDTPGPYCT